MNNKFSLLTLLLTTFILNSLSITLLSQADRWQQRVVYQMDIDFDVNTHRFAGIQSITYVNNSPDTLNKVFYHLYLNAFQPDSDMDVRSRTVLDPDPRVSDRIFNLTEDEIGYQHILKLTHNGKDVHFRVVGTILEVTLRDPILPGNTALFEMEFESQVPLQIRRMGRYSHEGVAYSMAQWYPKMCNYDYQGWHANPYIGREFYGVWGDFYVNITIDKNFIVGAGAILSNAGEIGYGYTEEEGLSKGVSGDKITWKFIAENVHDFMWAADPEYKHTTHTTEHGTILHFFYKENEITKENWEMLPGIMDKALSYTNKHFGEYQYPVYYFIQGGDGGMEYPMGTLITGERNLRSLVGVSIHEWMHAWYHTMLATNESLYAWMDEGFTSFASNEVMNYLTQEKLIPGEPVDNPHFNSIRGFAAFALTGLEEPLSIHSDHFLTNRAYGVAAYTKGSVFLAQLEEIIGEKAFRQGLLRYFNTWKFKHPNDNDFIRIMEKQSELELDWYKEYMVYTTHTIDYGIDSVSEVDGKTSIILKKIGKFPMPVDITILKKNDNEMIYNIPLTLMRGDKSKNTSKSIHVLSGWSWVNDTYEMKIDIPLDEIQSIHIDKVFRTADTDRSNNAFFVE